VGVRSTLVYVSVWVCLCVCSHAGMSPSDPPGGCQIYSGVCECMGVFVCVFPCRDVSF